MHPILLLVLITLATQVAQAGSERRYLTPMEQSKWTLTTDSPVLCQIEHEIPRFGKAVFYQHSGRALGLKLVSNHHYKKDLAVAFRSASASWHPTRNQAMLGDSVTTGGNNPLLDITDNSARHAYFELQQGYQPSLFFIDEEDGSNAVSVVLSTVRFRDVEADFGRCLTRLHPRNFNDVKTARVHFDFDEEFPRVEEEEKALAEQLAYLEADPSVKRLVISGHADFKGSECYNDTLSARRAWYIYDYLVQSGIEPSMLEVKFYGETRPIDEGRGDEARARNRRVTVELVK